MRWDSVDLDKAEWTIAKNKAGRPLVVPLPKLAVQMLQEITKNWSDRLFVYRRPVMGRPGREVASDPGSVNVGRRSFSAACARAGIEDCHPHDLLRTVATHLARWNGEPFRFC
jgi:integrase